MAEKKLIVYTDGGARGNPGPAAVGVYVLDSQGKEIARFGKKIGETTNNVAEYEAVIAALQWINENKLKLPMDKVEFFIDSVLIVNQLNGLFKIKDYKLKELIMNIRRLEQQVGIKIFYHRISREKNKIADCLVNLSLGQPKSL